MMVIYKFGGASVKNVQSFHLLKDIVSGCKDQLIIVVSAMGKTTNHLEEIVKYASKGSDDWMERLESLRSYHLGILEELVPHPDDAIFNDVDLQFSLIRKRIQEYKDRDFNCFYDQVVSLGEIISTKIVSRFLDFEGLPNAWLDVRKLLVTDDNYRDAAISFQASKDKFIDALKFDQSQCYVIQGFIGSEKGGHTTTLGREGSDYSAAVLASFFDAEQVTLWKDVDGIFNADPALFSNVTQISKIGYQEMIELAYYGAKVIHPKTIKPLRQKQIPLFVKSFYDPDKPGSVISDFEGGEVKIPIIIVKDEQVLISISLDDLSFITEYHISLLFGLLNKFRLKANLMQHSAVSFSVSVDRPRGKEVEELISILRMEFRVLYNDQLTLLTIRHYTEDVIAGHIAGKKVYVEQRSRNTVQYLIA